MIFTTKYLVHVQHEMKFFKLLHNFACLVNWLIVKEYFHKYLLNDRYLDTYKMHMNGSKQDLTNFSKRYWNQGKIAIPVHVTGTTAQHSLTENFTNYNTDFPKDKKKS